jgi:hypothetical protein
MLFKICTTVVLCTLYAYIRFSWVPVKKKKIWMFGWVPVVPCITLRGHGLED